MFRYVRNVQKMICLSISLINESIQWWWENNNNISTSWNSRGAKKAQICFFRYNIFLTILPKPHETQDRPRITHIHISKTWAVKDGFAGLWIMRYHGRITANRRKNPTAGIHQPTDGGPVISSLFFNRMIKAIITPKAMQIDEQIKSSVLIF